MMVLDDLLLRAARFWSAEIAIQMPGSVLTYAELADEVTRWSERLAALDLERGSRISLVARNSAAYASLYFAAARLGLVAVAHNWRLLPRELADQVEDACAAVVIADAASAGPLSTCREGLTGVRTWIDLDGHTDGWLAPDALARRPGVASRPDEDEVVVQMYTSGTTGRSKGAMLTHRNLCHMVLAWTSEMPLVGGRSRFLQVTPFFHVGGLVMILINVAHGSTLLLEPEFQPARAIRRLRDDRATHALLVPAMIRWMLLDPAMKGATFPDLELILYGASPFPAAQLLEAMEAFDCGFLQAYGLTETAGVVTALRPDAHRHALAHEPALLDSCGRVMLGCETRIVDPTGREVPPGEPGEILVRGGNVFVGYWRNPEATAEALRDGWLWTGDIGRCDERGYITIVDRSKDMIIVGGENVYPSEVEAAIRGVPGVDEVAVIGIPHKVWGESVLALVVRQGQADEHELRQAVIDASRSRLARFKCPSRVEFVDAFPRTPSGKVQKSVLRAPYWSERSRAV